MEILPGLTVLVGEHGCGTSTLLRSLHSPPSTVLLEQPPGQEWSDHQVATHALEAPHLVGREYWTLSGGVLQRVRLGTALAQDGVLLLVEAVVYLDATGVATVVRALKGRTAVVVCKCDPSLMAHTDQVIADVDVQMSVCLTDRSDGL